MKAVVVIALMLVAVDIYGQTHSPKAYLNTEEIDLENVYINTSSIDEIATDGKEAHITAKRPVIFMTLPTLLKNKTDIDDSANQVVYIINHKLIVDKSKVKVDTSFYVRIEVKRLDKVSSIDEKYRTLILAEIELLEKAPKPLHHR